MPKYVWASCRRLEIAKNRRDLALFNLAIGSKPWGLRLVKLKLAEIYASGHPAHRGGQDDGSSSDSRSDRRVAEALNLST